MWFLMKCVVGFFPFCGWFISFYLGEMILTWILIVPDHPELAELVAYILTIPAAMLALRKAKQTTDRWERGLLR